MLTQNPPEFAQLAAVSAEETHRDEGVATEAPRLRAALGRGGVPRRPLQGARRSFPFARRFFRDEKRRFVSTRSFHRCLSSGARFRATLRDAKKSRVCDCRAEPPPEARATPRSRDARRRTRPRPASSGDAVGGSARGTRDRAANATRMNRLFVYAPPKPSTLRDDVLYERKDRSRRGAFSRAGCVGRTLRTLHARVRFTRITTLTDHIFPLLDFHANENIRRVAGGVL